MKVINQGNLEGIGKTAPTVTNPRSQGGRDEMIVGVRVLNPINLKENIGVKGGVKVQNLINLKERREMIGAKVLNLENLDEKRKMMTLATFLNSRKEVKVKKNVCYGMHTIISPTCSAGFPPQPVLQGLLP